MCVPRVYGFSGMYGMCVNVCMIVFIKTIMNAPIKIIF